MKPKKKKKTREGKVTVNYNNLPGKEKTTQKKQKTKNQLQRELQAADFGRMGPVFGYFQRQGT